MLDNFREVTEDTFFVKMFAVPGWNLSAPLKAQEFAPKQPVTGANSQAVNGEGTNAKKRKRGFKDAKSREPKVTAANVAEMWEQVIEGKPAPKEKRGKKDKKQKKGKDTSDIQEKQSGENGQIESHLKGAEADATISLEDHGVDELKPKKKQKKMKESKATADAPISANTALPAPPPALPANAKLTPLQASMRQKLASARFRHLNQTLYTTPSTESFSLFASNPDMFDEYHAGFRQQVAVWPENPVDSYIRDIRLRGQVGQEKSSRWKKFGKGTGEGATGANATTASDAPPLPRDLKGTCRIADLGCGDASLAASLQSDLQKLKLQVHSFDLQSPSPLVTKADIANLPFRDGSFDVAVFCLALMGTNWTDFIDEAYRVLRWKGELWVSEIKSRFSRAKKGGVVDHSVGKQRKKGPVGKKQAAETEAKEDDEVAAVEVDGVDDSKNKETDVNAFVAVLGRRGFTLQGEPDLSNRMFVKMRFIKAADAVKGKNVKSTTDGGDSTTWKKKPKGKWLEDADVDVEDENKVLKPCVYKLR